MSSHRQPTSRESTFAFRAALDAAQMSQAEFARCAGMTPRNVNRIYQGELPVPRACMVILSIICGLDNAIGGQDLGEEPDLNQALFDARAGKLQEFEIRHDHVFRRSETYKSLVKRFHPDRAKRDTTEEMQIINHF